ncbi:hypothetical protein [Aureimonas ureilytica]|uniref:hypothetical protein n=1 Tax=Aureimonas ureilytica TaxID=401562 RepID=UPI00187C384A|nr:hypothetical protein [Aureimonas ureilytica]
MSAPGTAAVVVPPDVPMPWWGYVLVGVVNVAASAALCAIAVYRAPANTPPSPEA